MGWNNVDLKSHEVESNILDSYSFETLLLEVNCNLPEITKETVRRQFLESLKANIETAKEIFEANLDNVVKHAQSKRNNP